MILRYSIRGLLLFIALLACVGGWVSYQYRCCERERQAAVTLEGDYEISVFLEESDPNDYPYIDWSQIRFGRLYKPISDLFASDEEHAHPIDRRAWDCMQALRYLENIHLQDVAFADSVDVKFSDFPRLKRLYAIRVCLTGTTASDIANLNSLEELDLYSAGATDEWLARFARMRRLRGLGVDGDISDAGVAHLAAASQLRRLCLDDTRVTSKSAATLAKLKRLELLSLANTCIDDECLAQIAGLPLEYLFLSHTKITDDGLAHLATCEQLGQLSLRGTSVTDQGVARLARLPHLWDVSLAGTHITKTSLAALSRIRSLRRDWVNLRDTFISEAEADAWRMQAAPK